MSLGYNPLVECFPSLQKIKKEKRSSSHCQKTTKMNGGTQIGNKI
jgi:hypothetical protein